MFIHSKLPYVVMCWNINKGQIQLLLSSFLSEINCMEIEYVQILQPQHTIVCWKAELGLKELRHV